MAASGSILGNAVKRLEDPTLLTGEGKYVDDLVETGALHVAFVRSTIAHGRVVAVDDGARPATGRTGLFPTWPPATGS